MESAIQRGPIAVVEAAANTYDVRSQQTGVTNGLNAEEGRRRSKGNYSNAGTEEQGEEDGVERDVKRRRNLAAFVSHAFD